MGHIARLWGLRVLPEAPTSALLNLLQAPGHTAATYRASVHTVLSVTFEGAILTGTVLTSTKSLKRKGASVLVLIFWDGTVFLVRWHLILNYENFKHPQGWSSCKSLSDFKRNHIIKSSSTHYPFIIRNCNMHCKNTKD